MSDPRPPRSPEAFRQEVFLAQLNKHEGGLNGKELVHMAMVAHRAEALLDMQAWELIDELKKIERARQVDELERIKQSQHDKETQAYE